MEIERDTVGIFTNATRDRITARPVGLLLEVWFILAVIAGWFGALTYGPQAVALTIVGITAAVLLLTLVIVPLQRDAAGLPLSALVWIHTLRIFGALFLYFAGRGIPADWALPAGWADIAIAVAAAPVAMFAMPVTSRARWNVVMTWNLIGLIDILAAPLAAVIYAILDPGSMHAMQFLPLAIVPLFFLPLMIGAHVLLTARLIRERRYLEPEAATTPP